MDAQKIDMFLLNNGKFFDPTQITIIREKLVCMDDSRFVMLQSLPLKDPTMMLIISILVGVLGVDRFMLGDTGLGVAKLLTCGGAGIWTIVDWFTIMDRTRKNNMTKIQALFL